MVHFPQICSVYWRVASIFGWRLKRRNGSIFGMTSIGFRAPFWELDGYGGFLKWGYIYKSPILIGCSIISHSCLGAIMPMEVPRSIGESRWVLSTGRCFWMCLEMW